MLFSGLAITRAGQEQAGALHEILSQAGEDIHRRHGLSHWVPPYPRLLFEQAVIERCVYGVNDAQGRTIATFTLGDGAPDYYANVAWADPGAVAAYLSRLAVLSAEQGRGLGAWCMGQAERLAKDAGATTLRFDTHAWIGALHRFYARLGYQRRGVVTWRDDDQLLCWEKSLS